MTFGVSLRAEPYAGNKNSQIMFETMTAWVSSLLIARGMEDGRSPVLKVDDIF